MSWDDKPPTKEELEVASQPKAANWDSTPPSDDELGKPSIAKSLMSGIAEAGGLSKVLAPLGDTVMKGITGVQGPLAGGSMQDLLDNYRQQRDSLKNEFQQNAQAHPIAHFAGNVVGSAPLAMALSGAPLAKGADLATKVAHGAALGGKFGLASGALNSNADLTQADPAQYGQAAQDTLTSGVGGAVTGGMLPIAGQAVKSGLQTIFPKMSTAAQIGNEGTFLNETGRGKVVKEAEDLANKYVGPEGVLTGKTPNSLVSTKGQAIKDALSKASGTNVDVSKLADDLTDMFNSLDDRNPLEAADKKTLSNLLANYTEGLPVEKEIRSTKYTPQSTEEIPAVPSAREKLMAQAQKLNAANNFEGGSSNPGESTLGASPYNVKDVPGDEGQNFLGLFNKDKGLQGKLYEDTPGSPAQQNIIPAEAGPEQLEGTYTTREGGSTDLDVSDLQSLKKALSGYSQVGDKGLQSQNGSNIASRAAGMAGDLTETAAPGIGEANEDFHNLMEKVLKPLGAKGPGGLADQDTQVENLRNLIRRYKDAAFVGDNAKSDVDKAMAALTENNPDVAAQMSSDISNTAQRVKVARQAQAEPFTMKTPLGAINSMGLKAANTIGFAAGKINGALFNAPKEAIGNLGHAIQMDVSDPATAEFNARLGGILVEAASRDDVGRNALLFSLMQQPQYRAILNKYMGNSQQTQ